MIPVKTTITMTFLFPIVNPDQRVFLAFAVIFAIIPVFMVGLRVLARRIANRRLGLSDWLMISATVSAPSVREVEKLMGENLD